MAQANRKSIRVLKKAIKAAHGAKLGRQVAKTAKGYARAKKLVKAERSTNPVKYTVVADRVTGGFKIERWKPGVRSNYAPMSKAAALAEVRKLHAHYKMNPGKGAFKRCVKAVSKRKGVYSPRGVCATAGRAKYGAKVFAAMGLAARKKNPGSVATLSYGTKFAEVTKKGPDQFIAEVTQKGKKVATKVWKSLRQAMEWAKDQIFSVKNPVDEAEKMFEMFHGYPSKEVIEYVEKEHRHSVLAGLGTLVEMHVLNVAGNRTAVLTAPDPETAQFADVIQVAVSEDGKQLYLVGGDQKIPLKTLESDFGMTQADVRDKMLIGTITRLTYRTVKSFEAKGQKQVDFYHDLGREHSKGIMPVLEYKPRNPSLEIIGGRYYIAPGERSLKGMSPGIVG